jgi:hypothetical protein
MSVFLHAVSAVSSSRLATMLLSVYDYSKLWVSTCFNTKMSLPLDYWVSVHSLMWQMFCWWYTPWSTITTFPPYLNPLHLTPSVIHSSHCLKLHCSLITINYMGQSPEKLTGPQLVKKLPAFYGTWRFITLFTRDCHLSLTSARSIQSMPPPSHYFKIRFNSILPSILRSSVVSFPQVSPPKPCYAVLFSSICVTCPDYLNLFIS